MRGGRCSRGVVVAVAWAFAWGSARPALAVEITAIETVALSTDTAPGAGVPYTLFSRAWLNDAGELLFYGTVSGGAAGLWWWTGSGDPSAVALTGMDAPVLGPAQLESIDSSDTWAGARGPAFFGTLADGGGVTSENDEVAYGSDGGGALAVIAREGASAPGAGTQTFGAQLIGANYGSSSDFGMVFANRTELAGGGFGNRSLWRQSGATATLLAIEDDTAPGVPGGAMIDFRGSVVNDLGVTVTWVRVNTVGRALYSFSDDAPLLLALEGEPAPGTAADFQSITEDPAELGINDAGDYAFRSGLSDGRSAVFGPDAGGGTRLLLRSTDPAPGTATAVFAAPSHLALAADGSMVIEAFLQTDVGGTTSATDFGLWGSAGYGPLELVARQGDRPTGLPAGARFDAFQRWELNGAGQVILGATYFPPASGVAEDGLWHHDLYTGTTSLLLRKGDVVEIAPGDSRTINFITAGRRASGGQDGKGQAWNDAGQLAAALTFGDGSRGVFRLTVPEPASGAALTALAALVALASRRAPA